MLTVNCDFSIHVMILCKEKLFHFINLHVAKQETEKYCVIKELNTYVNIFTSCCNITAVI